MTKVIFSKSSQGHLLKTPVTVNLPDAQNETETKLQKYIIESCMYKMPRLVPFVVENSSMMELAKHLFLHCSGSPGTLETRTRSIYNFCRWASTSPDKIVSSCKNPDKTPNFKGINDVQQVLDEYALYLQGKDIATNTVIHALVNIRSLFRSNFIKLGHFYHRPRIITYQIRSPTINELRTLVNAANLRERLTISILATSGIRAGTLLKLKYKHIKHDFERNILPIHVRINSEITKAKNHDYSTFFNQETAEYLTAYLNARKIGTDWIPPEKIVDESPLIRPRQKQTLRLMSSFTLIRDIRRLFFRTGMLTKKTGTRRYELNVHAFRKFFRTQMAFLGVDKEYIDYMMGHKTDTYFDAEMKGVEYLRHIYEKSGISIRPQPEIGKMAIVRELIFKLGLDPEKVLNQNFITQSFKPT